MILKTRNSGNFLPSVFDDFFNTERSENRCEYSQPNFNVYETDKEFVVEAAAPGMEKKDFDVEVDANVLKISGKKEVANEDNKQRNYFYKEFCYGKFVKSYSLPENVNADKISAAYENGILKITIPKENEVKVNRQIKIG